ncbi:MAG: type II secretion system minor pseudopilin GspK [Porticoccaceae bacterium]
MRNNQQISTMSSSFGAAPRQRGVALLATLILTLAVTIILGNIFYRHQIEVSQAAGSLHSDQAILLAISAESWARDLVSGENDNFKTDHFEEDWAQAIPFLPVDGGSVAGCIVDLQSRFNLNSLSSYTVSPLQREMDGTNMGHARVWESLLQSLDYAVDGSRIAVIIDWLDKDDSPINPSGAERSEYSIYDPPRFPHNNMISDIGELAAMEGYSLRDVQVLSPWITALPALTPININTASEQMLLALGGDMGMEFVELVLSGRPYGDLSEFYGTLNQYLMIGEPQVQLRWPAKLVDVKTTFFQLNIEVTLGQSKLQVKSIMQRKGSGAPVVISREITVVPAGVEALTFASFSDDDSDTEADDNDKKYYMQPLCEAIPNNYNADY